LESRVLFFLHFSRFFANVCSPTDSHHFTASSSCARPITSLQHLAKNKSKTVQLQATPLLLTTTLLSTMKTTLSLLLMGLLFADIQGFSVLNSRRTTFQLRVTTDETSAPEPVMEEDSAVEGEPDSGDLPAAFDSLGLSNEILSAVRSQPGWEIPTPVQCLAIPQILAGEDTVWCEAPTGSGKTAAYALPLLQKLYRKDTQGIASLVLCPTRELAVQIGHVISQLSHNVGGQKKWNVVVLHGGVQLDPQITALSHAARTGQTVDVVVATPGRLVDVLTYYDDDKDSRASESAMERRLLDALDGKGRTDSSLSLSQIEDLELDSPDDDGRSSMRQLLSGVEYLVIDEADRLLGKAFEKEVESCLDLLMTDDREELPAWLFSATFPKSVEPRVAHVLKRLGGATPLRISCSNVDRVIGEEVSTSLQKRLARTSGAATTLQQIGPASTIKLRTIRLDITQRTRALRQLLQDNPEWDRVLVFVATRYAAEHVARKLRRVGIDSAELHGKLDQEARSRRLRAFSKGKTRVLLATDVASRGLDVVGLPAVVNYDLPRSTADFVHRVGRTGRAGKQGTAVTFVTAPSESHLDLIELRHLAEPIEREDLPGFEPNEDSWQIQSSASRLSAPGTLHSTRGLAHDRMNGGIKGRRKSKKDRLREEAARARRDE
jgi:ATP-dependent RNA helicase RhlE